MLLNLVCEHFVEVLASIFIRAIDQKLSFLGMCLSEFGIRVILATRPFQYDLNQIPYYYTVEVTNKFRGLQCHFEDALSFLPLGHVLPIFIFSPCYSLELCIQMVISFLFSFAFHFFSFLNYL